MANQRGTVTDVTSIAGPKSENFLGNGEGRSLTDFWVVSIDTTRPTKKSGSGGRRPVSTVFGNQCAQCGADIIAAQWSEHLSESCVRNVWSCEACGYQFEDTIYLPAQEAAADAR